MLLIYAQFVQFIILYTHFSSKLSHIVYKSSILHILLPENSVICVQRRFSQNTEDVHLIILLVVKFLLPFSLYYAFCFQHSIWQILPYPMCFSFLERDRVKSFRTSSKINFVSAVASFFSFLPNVFVLLSAGSAKFIPNQFYSVPLSSSLLFYRLSYFFSAIHNIVSSDLERPFV